VGRKLLALLASGGSLGYRLSLLLLLLFFDGLGGLGLWCRSRALLLGSLGMKLLAQIS
jgi:hypothetical protein